jgi:O-methyltransferase involved in polyketide biosynthesis
MSTISSVNAVTEGIDAVVILGAGYDTRAYRLPEWVCVRFVGGGC